MSATTYLLATHDPELLRAWWVLVPAGARVVTLSELLHGEALLAADLPLVMVVDAASASDVPAAYEAAPRVFVGDRAGPAFAQSAEGGARCVCLSKEESQTRLGEFLPLLEDLALRSATAHLLFDKSVATGSSRAVKAAACEADREGTRVEADWIGEAIEVMGDRDALLSEFARGLRRALRTSRVLFFLREEAGGFRAEREGITCGSEDAVSQYLRAHPTVIDGVDWPRGVSPVMELSLRQCMIAWAVRMIVPLHDSGRLLGWIGLGLRDDGQAYAAGEAAHAVRLARLLRQMLTSGAGAPGGAAVRSRKEVKAEESLEKLAAKYLPGRFLLAAGEAVPESVPPLVRKLIVDVRQARSTQRILPLPGQPVRASAGVVAETGGVWVNWEDASAELQELHRRARAERLVLLHDLALTLNHELGNSLVSLAALRHNPGAQSSSPVLLAAIKRDIAALEAINRHLASLPTFSEVAAESVDLRALVFAVGRKCGIVVETDSHAVVLDVAPRLIEFGLESIIESIAENRPNWGKRELVLSLRPAEAGAALTALLTIRGPELALEGILPAPEPGATPTHGRIGVFIAKEIIQLHGGSIEAGAGVAGSEIIISLRAW